MTEKKVHIARVDQTVIERGVQRRATNPSVEYLASHSGLIWINETEGALYMEQSGSARKVFFDDVDTTPFLQKTDPDGVYLGWNGSQLVMLDVVAHSHGAGDLSGVALASHNHTQDDLSGVALASHTHTQDDLSGVALASHGHSYSDLSGVAAASHSHSAVDLPPVVLFDSDWITGSIASASHGIVDIDSITDVRVLEEEISSSHRRFLPLSTPIKYYDTNVIVFDWFGFDLVNNKYKVIVK